MTELENESARPHEDRAEAERAFTAAMSEIYRRAKDEAGYNATIFLRMLSERGALATAHALIHTDKPSDGFTRLWERNRLDLTVEAHVLKPAFESLFTEDERQICRARLAAYGLKG